MKKILAFVLLLSACSCSVDYHYRRQGWMVNASGDTCVPCAPRYHLEGDTCVLNGVNQAYW